MPRRARVHAGELPMPYAIPPRPERETEHQQHQYSVDVIRRRPMGRLDPTDLERGHVSSSERWSRSWVIGAETRIIVRAKGAAAA